VEEAACAELHLQGLTRSRADKLSVVGSDTVQQAAGGSTFHPRRSSGQRNETQKRHLGRHRAQEASRKQALAGRSNGEPPFQPNAKAGRDRAPREAKAQRLRGDACGECQNTGAQRHLHEVRQLRRDERSVREDMISAHL